MLNEKGAIYPLTLVVTLIAFLVIFETTVIYVAEYGYVIEIRDFYEKETKQLLLNISDSTSYSTTVLPHNLHLDSGMEIME